MNGAREALTPARRRPRFGPLACLLPRAAGTPRGEQGGRDDEGIPVHGRSRVAAALALSLCLAGPPADQGPRLPIEGEEPGPVHAAVRRGEENPGPRLQPVSAYHFLCPEIIRGVADHEFYLVFRPEAVQVRAGVAADVVAVTREVRFDDGAARPELARDHEPVAAVVPLAADDNHWATTAEVAQEVDASPAGVLHKDEARHLALGNRPAVDFADFVAT